MAEIKSFSSDQRTILHKVIPLDTPFVVSIETSSVCNFKCRYCIQSSSREEMAVVGFQPKIMDWETFERTAGQLKAFKEPIKTILLHGHGEPLCNKKIADMVAYLKREKVCNQVEFFTNASLLNEDMASHLIDAGLDSLKVSLQGLSSEKYKEICASSVGFERIVDNIRFFYNHRGSSKIFIKVIDIALEENEEQKFYNIFSEIADRVFIEKAFCLYDTVDYNSLGNLSGTERKLINKYGESIDLVKVCPTSFYNIFVFANGDIAPCASYKKVDGFQNVNETTLYKFWNGNKRLEFLKQQLEGNRIENEVCEKCNIVYSVIRDEDVLDEYTDELLKKISITLGKGEPVNDGGD